MSEEQNIYESGILERYLTGDLSEMEIVQVEELLARDKTLKEHLAMMEVGLESMAKDHAITPPAVVKQRLFDEISDTSPDVLRQSKKYGPLYFAIAAGLSLLFAASAFWFYNQTKALENQLEVVSLENETLEDNLTVIATQLEDREDLLQFVQDKDTKKLVMQEVPTAPEINTIAYLNQKAKKVLVATENLPELPEDKDYQMWADVAGEMIDMGILSKQKDLIAMKFIEDATSLNITIEPKGGSEHATVANLVANSYILP